MKLTTVAVLSLAALTGTALQAKACNPLLNKNYGKHVAPTVIPAAMLARNQPNVAQSTAIVGLWHDVRTASDGSMFMEGFDTWYADGNENELANFPPATGAYCTGHWTKHGKTAELTTHVAFLYDTSNNFHRHHQHLTENQAVRRRQQLHRQIRRQVLRSQREPVPGSHRNRKRRTPRAVIPGCQGSGASTPFFFRSRHDTYYTRDQIV